ncbi:PAS domain-containing protein [Roseobacter sp. HKCCA0434]|uniref:PAS domain-containing protein n=1 Tax=Roseobacter sp. HKCCA0434 TaxID=3079297 RepID=UPI002905DB87|nr:PAS domain-containing protein [Roseobacter sp. HKCCA0434]
MNDDRNRTEDTRQDQLEINPQEHQDNANPEPESLGLDTAALFEQALEQTRMAITLVDPFAPDQPIVYCNRAFVDLTGYTREEAVGKNCRFLQGQDTDPDSVAAIRAALEANEVRVIEILNYRKDGTPFWNALHVGPVLDDRGELTHYYGSQWDITAIVEDRRHIALQSRVAEELEHRTGNLFNVIASILRVTARTETEIAPLVQKVEARLAALNLAHRSSISAEQNARHADLRDFVQTITAPYTSAETDRVIVRGEPVDLLPEAVTPLGLMLHELATNALKYGALGSEGGKVDIAWQRRGDRLHLVWTETGGPQVARPSRAGTGSRLTEGVLAAIGATLTYDWPPTGLTATLDMRLGRED